VVDQDKAPEGQEEKPQEAAPARDTSHMKWYVIHTYSGYENKAKLALLERAKAEGLEDKIGEVLIPTEQVVEMVKGAKRVSSRKFYPGYMFVKMVDPAQNQRVWHLIKNTPKVTGFVGDQTNPQPVPEKQILAITKQITEGETKPKPKVQFEEGEHVRVIDGPFSNFNGIVEEVKPEKGKLRVLVSIFGRATPVELDFIQVEKT
jgi:transcriptional antiterminator NusG